MRYEREIQAADTDTDDLDDVKELAVADYLVFLLAVDTYMRYQSETSGRVDPTDATLAAGLSLLRRAERASLDAIAAFMKGHLSSSGQIKMLEAGLRPPPSPDGAALRAFKFRTVLTRGGATTAKAVFGTSNKARMAALDAMEAANIDDPDAALARLSAIILRNKVLERWVKLASEVAVPGTVQLNPIQEAVKGASDGATDLVREQSDQVNNPGTDAGAEAGDKQAAGLAKIEADAREAAKRAMATSNTPDEPVTRSEAIAVATSVAVAVSSDPALEKNIPPALRRLDPEQRQAAMTGGKVRVSAGAGSGKSTTLLARVQYLIDNGAVPNRMMVMSFNTKAAAELGQKMASKIGSEKVSTSKNRNPNGVQVGTMHSTFLQYINQYGTPEQVNIFARVNGKGGMVSASTLFKTCKDIWEECFPYFDKDPPGDPEGKTREVPPDELWKMPPKSSRMMAYLNIFQGQGMSLMQVKDWCDKQGTIEAYQALRFFGLYEGLKGSRGGWKPNLCGKDTYSPKFAKFVDFYRAGKPRVGDFNDMLSVFRDILKSNPQARAKVQSQLDHVMVDECQDLNPLQNEILNLMTEHVRTDDTNKSFWMVGDDKQSIYQFRGADPANFIALDEQGFKDRQITTNYRCAPEFVDAANKLIAHNKNQIPMEAKAAPHRARGEASLNVVVTGTDTEAAVEFGKKVLAAVAAGEPLSNFAVLARTNAELGVFQRICAVTGTRFVQKKAASVFGSQETDTFRTFMNVAAGTSPRASRESFCQALMNGGVLKPKLSIENRAENVKLADKAMKKAMQDYCTRYRIPFDSFDPLLAVQRDPLFLSTMIKAVTGSEYGAKKDAERARSLIEGFLEIRQNMEDPEYLSKDLFESILALPIVESVAPDPGQTLWTTKIESFRDATTKRLSNKASQEDAEEDSELSEEKSVLGSLDFVMMMMQPQEVDPAYNPQDPRQFQAKFDGLATRAEELRIDPDEWEKEQIAQGVPLSERKPPPGVYLGTAHSTKGAEWPDVTVLMPQGKFPMERKPRKPKENEIPEEALVDPETALEAERRLGYVALTRAQKNLTILCPGAPSPFVGEAGLVKGQNVPQPATLTPGAVPATDVSEAAAPEEPLDWDEVGADLDANGVKVASPEYTYNRDLLRRHHARCLHADFPARDGETHHPGLPGPGPSQEHGAGRDLL